MKNKPTQVVQGRGKLANISGTDNRRKCWATLEVVTTFVSKICSVILSDQQVAPKCSPHAFLGKMFSVPPTGLFQSSWGIPACICTLPCVLPSWCQGWHEGSRGSLPVLVLLLVGGWHGGCSGGFGRVQHTLPSPQGQKGLLTASLTQFPSQRRLLLRMEQVLLGLVGDTCCWAVPWVPWGSSGAVPEPSLPAQLWLLCVLPDVFQSPSGSWSLLL